MINVDVKLRFEFLGGGLWVASTPSRWGLLEIVVNGNDDKPDESDLSAVAEFFRNASQVVEALRRREGLSFLSRPIRLAVNTEHRLGIQFQNRILSGRRAFFFADGKPAPSLGPSDHPKRSRLPR